jgi:hypothetical protein
LGHSWSFILNSIAGKEKLNHFAWSFLKKNILTNIEDHVNCKHGKAKLEKPNFTVKEQWESVIERGVSEGQ